MPTLTQLFSKSNTPELIPIYVTEDGKYLYYVQNYGGDPDDLGRIIKRDLSTGNETILLEKAGYATWQGVYIKKDNKIYLFGEAKDAGGTFRSTVAIVDLSNDNVTVIQHPNTGDCNEFIGVAYDEKNDRFIVGERPGGGNTTGSNWPNGGGLWIIPRSTITDPSTWQRVYEFSAFSGRTYNPEARKIVIYGDTVFILLRDSMESPVIGRLVKGSLNDLTTWETIEEREETLPTIGAHGDIIAYLSLSEQNTLVIKYSTDGGNTWTSIDTQIDASTDKRAEIMVYGKYVILVHERSTTTNPANVYIVDIVSQTTSNVGSMSNPQAVHTVGTQRHENVYIGNKRPPSGNGYVYKLTFDTVRRLSLSADKYTANPGDTITLIATLTDDQGNPIQGETIEFYVVRCGVDDRITGEKIGSQPTNENGQATINYTLPNTEGKVWFRALYKG